MDASQFIARDKLVFPLSPLGGERDGERGSYSSARNLPGGNFVRITKPLSLTLSPLARGEGTAIGHLQETEMRP